jgi:hypothetical protein
VKAKQKIKIIKLIIGKLSIKAKVKYFHNDKNKEKSEVMVLNK